MESELARDRRRRQLVLTLGLVLGLVAAGVTYLLASRPQTAVTPTPTPPPQRTIVIAAADIPARTLIAEAMVETTTLADDPSLERTVSDTALVVGKVTVVDVFAGQALTSNLYGDGNAAGVLILKPGETVGPDSEFWRAVSVAVPRDRAVAGLVRAGDRVDLTVTLEVEIFDEFGQPVDVVSGFTAGQATKIVWLDLEVINADAEAGLYVVRVDLHQAEEINHIQTAAGNLFSLSLRPLADTRPIVREDYGETLDRFVAQYGFPVPQLIPLPGVSPGPSPSPGGPSPEPSPSPSPAP